MSTPRGRANDHSRFFALGNCEAYGPATGIAYSESWNRLSGNGLPAKPAPPNALQCKYGFAKARALSCPDPAHGLSPSRNRLFSSVRRGAKIGAFFPTWRNRAFGFDFGSAVNDKKSSGLAGQRHWQTSHSAVWTTGQSALQPQSGHGVGESLGDTFVRYPSRTSAFAEWQVWRPQVIKWTCSPKKRESVAGHAFSQGHPTKPGTLGQRITSIGEKMSINAPILFLEPSCYRLCRRLRRIKMSQLPSGGETLFYLRTLQSHSSEVIQGALVFTTSRQSINPIRTAM